MESLPQEPVDVTVLWGRLEGLGQAEKVRLGRRIAGTKRIKDLSKRDKVLRGLASQVDQAQLRITERRANMPAINYPAALPVSQRKDEIKAAIRDHQVVIVAGETGSGKTTQIPKICLELGRGVLGKIGHTQPRRIAARTVAERISEELASPIGQAVGFKIRFSDSSTHKTLVKLMTDGILLAEIQTDPMLWQYDTIIIDEAHERSLNIDFLLGYLRQLLPKRPDLKLIVTSATIETARFSDHFRDATGVGAPVVEVSGRTFPVEVWYRPMLNEKGQPERDESAAIGQAVQELQAERTRDGGQDILVFLSGEREIRDTADALKAYVRPGTDIVPLYGRLSAAEQHKVFEEHSGRRVVLATNVAETSLTVPGIRYVIDPGTARISRYSRQLKVQRLPIEAISQASANQRKGRCGRVAEGICIRLYSEADFLARPEYTDPEILRTNLASVILRMTALGFGDIAAFGFVDPPDRRNVRDGLALLHELGAIDSEQSDPSKRLTPLGKRLALLPLDPRLGRMLLEAERNGCVRQLLIITSALSIQDPRERPIDKQQAADRSHARFADERSDFISLINLWDYVREQQQTKSSSAFRRMCRTEFLHYLRVREWQDLEGQLRGIVSDLGININDHSPISPDLVHQSLLAGLLSHIGLKDDARTYLGARGAKFALWPGSVLVKNKEDTSWHKAATEPSWVMAAELVETSRLWARTAAFVQPEWIEPLAAHLLRHSYSEPHWESSRGSAVGLERVTLYGIPLVVGRKIEYGQIDPELARDLFIREAMVGGDWNSHHGFLQANRDLLEQAQELEDRTRQRGIVVDDEDLVAFYDERIPPEATSTRHFDAWWKKARQSEPDLLSFSESMLLAPDAANVDVRGFPTTWQHGDLNLEVTYRFEPGAEDDGVSVHIPIALINRTEPDAFGWQVPGLREELVIELLRSLPKSIRTSFVPAPDWARKVIPRLAVRKGLITDQLGTALSELSSVIVPRSAWDLSKVDDHLRVRFVVSDDAGEYLAAGRDLEALKAELALTANQSLRSAVGDVQRTGITKWDIGTLPKVIERGEVRGYPTLVDESDSVGIRIVSTPGEQAALMWSGTRRLLELTVPPPGRRIIDGLPGASRLALARAPHGGLDALLADCERAAIDEQLNLAGGPAWDEVGFETVRSAVAGSLGASIAQSLQLVEQVLLLSGQVREQLSTLTKPAWSVGTADARHRLDALVFPGFVAATGARRVADMPRYLQALSQRLDRLRDDPARDAVAQRTLTEVELSHREFLDQLPVIEHDRDDVIAIRWMIEELRISLFAPTMKTSYPISVKRIDRAMSRIEPET